MTERAPNEWAELLSSPDFWKFKNEFLRIFSDYFLWKLSGKVSRMQRQYGEIGARSRMTAEWYAYTDGLVDAMRMGEIRERALRLGDNPFYRAFVHGEALRENAEREHLDDLHEAQMVRERRLGRERRARKKNRNSNQ